MAATIFWVEWITGETPGTTPHDDSSFKTGGDTPATITAATNINFGSVSARDLTPGSNTITANTASFTKYFRAQFSGSYTTISNAKLWKSAGVYVTGEDIQFSGSLAYVAPTATDATDPSIETDATGTATSNNYVGLNAYDPSDLAASSRSLPHANESSSSPGLTGEVDYYSGSRTSTMRFQTVTTSSTPAGAVNQKTISLQYDIT